MSLASVILNWQEGDRVYSRLTTNIGRKKLIARLSAIGMLGTVKSIHAFLGDPADGGNGYEVLWKPLGCMARFRPPFIYPRRLNDDMNYVV